MSSQNLVAHPAPFEVTSRHVVAVSKQMFPALLRMLLHAEARSHGMPVDGIHVPGNIDAPDGGEDGRIRWNGGPERTRFLPGRFCQFQLKTGKIGPKDAGNEVLTNGEVKCMIRSALEQDGYYIFLSTHQYTQQLIERRERHIREALRGARLAIDDVQVRFHDADWIAAWVNAYPTVATWLLEQVEPGLLGPFRSWDRWAARAEHSASRWVNDERIEGLRGFLLDQVAIAESRKAARIIGLTAVGKSRLVLEALCRFRSMVMYAVEGEASPETLMVTVQKLADSGKRAIVVVDQCAPELHDRLSRLVSPTTSQLSLVTIDVNVPTGTPDDSTYLVRKASSEVIETLVGRVAPGLQGSDQRRLVRFSRGFPGIAIRIARAWTSSTPLAHATEDNLVDAYVLGSGSPEPVLLLKSAALLATFGMIGIEPEADAQLENIASLGRNLSSDDLHVGLIRLTERGIARQKGRYVSFESGPITMRLAERQWKEWRKNTWDRVLTDNSASTSFAGNLNLNVLAAKQLKLLNTVDVSQKVVEHVCRYGGPFDGMDRIPVQEHAEVLSQLAEIDTGTVAGLLKRLLANVNDLSGIVGETRGHLVGTAAKIAFNADTFEAGARLLLRLAVAENEDWTDNATGRFVDLFPLILGGTEADGTRRIDLLESLSETDNPTEQELVVKALTKGLELDYFMRDVGPEVHGTRPELNSWQPGTTEEARAYVRGCATRLVDFAAQMGATGVSARHSLGLNLGSLIHHDFIDVVELAVAKVGTAVEYWPEARNGLGFYLSRHSSDASPEVVDRVQALIDALKPKSLEARVESLVTGVPFEYSGIHDHNYEEQRRRQTQAVHALAAEAVKHPETLQALLPQLSHGHQTMAGEFGQALAESTDSWHDWLEPIIRATEETEEAERNHDLLVGYVRGIADAQPTVVEALKQRAANSPLLAPVLPRLCSIDGFTAPDIALMIAALQNGLLSPGQLTWETVRLGMRDASPEMMSLLLDALLRHSGEGFAQALVLLGYHVHSDRNRLEAFRPQIRTIAENAVRWPWRNLPDPNGACHHFENVISWLFEQGPDDPDAADAALSLSKAVAGSTGYASTKTLESVLPLLLSRFPEVAWPLIGSAIVAGDPQQHSHFESMLGEPPWRRHGESTAPILNLPVDTLFAWCHAHPDRAPAFAARTVSLLEVDGDSDGGLCMHPVMIRLIEEFGDRENVTDAAIRSMDAKGWFRTEASLWTPYRQPMKQLRGHSSPTVQRWAKTTLRRMNKAVEEARVRDEEREARVED